MLFSRMGLYKMKLKSVGRWTVVSLPELCEYDLCLIYIKATFSQQGIIIAHINFEDK